jgi:hypothetical protein
MDDPADSWYTFGYINATVSWHAVGEEWGVGRSGGTPYAFR